MFWIREADVWDVLDLRRLQDLQFDDRPEEGGAHKGGRKGRGDHPVAQGPSLLLCDVRHVGKGNAEVGKVTLSTSLPSCV